jgi:hypothetical protein
MPSVKIDYGTEQEACALNGMEEPLKNKTIQLIRDQANPYIHIYDELTQKVCTV